MKRVITVFLLMSFVFVGFAAAESLDKTWIIREDTGSASTMERLDTPDLVPGQTIDVYLEKNELSVKWGEGYATYSFSYYSDTGKAIWTSGTFTEKKAASGGSWTFSKVHRVTLPPNIPAGAYRLGFTLTDYHSNTDYKGNASFTVGAGAPSAAAEGPGPSTPASTGEYTVMIGNIELTLVEVAKNSNRLTLTFQGVNRGDVEDKLSIYPYKTRIISDQGEEFVLSDIGGGGNLTGGGLRFAPGIPMKADLYYKPPAVKVNHLAQLEIHFYYFDDKVILRDIPVPWSSGR